MGIVSGIKGGAPIVSGTFTPTIQDNTFSDAEDQTYTTQLGYYRKIGDVVFFWLDVTINSLGSLTTTEQVRIGGLPFAANGSIHSACAVGYGDSLAVTAIQSVMGFVFLGTTRISVAKWSSAAGATALTIAELSAGGRLLISGQYFV